MTIFITGDTHADFRRFSSEVFPEQKEMTKDDHVIVCGHHHDNRILARKFVLLYEQIVEI